MVPLLVFSFEAFVSGTAMAAAAAQSSAPATALFIPFFGIAPRLDKLVVALSHLSAQADDSRDDDMEEEEGERVGAEETTRVTGLQGPPAVAIVQAGADVAEDEDVAKGRTGDGTCAPALSAPHMTGSDVSSRLKSSWSPPIP